MGGEAYGRRDLLRGAVGVAVAMATAGTAAPAAAVTPVATEDYRAVLDTACGPVGEHKRLIAERAAAAGLAADDPAIGRLLRGALCPICGCALLSDAARTDAPF